jgi:hypothetical protein
MKWPYDYEDEDEYTEEDQFFDWVDYQIYIEDALTTNKPAKEGTSK